jgi:hypothetical protein
VRSLSGQNVGRDFGTCKTSGAVPRLGARARCEREALMSKQPENTSTTVTQTSNPASDPAAKPSLSPAAERALAEAAVRRAEAARTEVDRPKEVSGRHGLDPTRYGDWEVNGLASDF